MKNKLLDIDALKILLFFVLMPASACTLTNNKDQPNIIILLIDDAGYADFGFAGSKDLKTPNIDKLAHNGTVFADAHVTASVCGPSRAGLMTGRYQQRFGFECNPSGNFTGLDLSETTIADAMKQAGYATAAFGKWHLGSGKGYHPNDRGFDYFWGFLSGSRSYFYNNKNDRPGEEHAILENRRQVKFNGYLTDCLGDKAVTFIDHNKNNPFFMYWSPNAVHGPMEATEEDLALFEGHPRQKLAAMTWSLDRAVGQIANKLEEENLLDNTLIFFLSDNGGAHSNLSSNYPLKGFKGNKFEGGQRVQFFMHWPNVIPESSTYNGLTSALDIFATSVGICGHKPKLNKPLDGENLLPYLLGEKEGVPHDKLYWRKGPTAAVRNGQYKLIWIDGLGYRMYDLSKDLSEEHDLSHAEKIQLSWMQSELKEWESNMMQPLWYEGAMWHTITKMIHEDLYDNHPIRVYNPNQLLKLDRELYLDLKKQKYPPIKDEVDHMQ